MTESVDLIVIGAGPAGSAAAIRYLQLRPTARVVLLDKAAFPRDKPCGDGLGPDAVSELVALGWSEYAYSGCKSATLLTSSALQGYSILGTWNFVSVHSIKLASPWLGIELADVCHFPVIRRVRDVTIG